MPPQDQGGADATSRGPVEVKAMPRLEFSVKLAVVAKVPPPKVNCPGVAAPGAAPRLLSAEICKIPPLIVVAPLYVLAPESVSVPVSVLVRPPAPAAMPP